MKRDVFPKVGDLCKLKFTYYNKVIEVNTTCLYAKTDNIAEGSQGNISLVGVVSLNVDNVEVKDFTFPSFECIFELRTLSNHRYRKNIKIYPKDDDTEARPNLHALASYLNKEVTASNSISISGIYPNFYFKVTKGE